MRTRREFLLGLGAGLLAAPFDALGQKSEGIRRIGSLVPLRRQAVQENMAHFERELRGLGWEEGRNLRVDWRFAEGTYADLRGLARELVALRTDLLVAFEGSATARALQEATNRIPIVFVNVGDPVAIGLVDSLAHPGRNATGLTNRTGDIAAKQVDMLRTIVHGLSRLWIIANPTNPMTPTLLQMLEAAGSTIHVKIDRSLVRNPAEIAAAFSLMAASRPGALIVGGDSFIFQQRAQIAESAARLGIPTIGSHVGYAEAGGLMSYGANPAESYRRAASLVDRILKGAKPADLPVEQPTKLQFVINRKTAKAIGVTAPADLLLLADRVIE